MAEIQPFRGIMYDVAEAELPKVLAPPYDVIPPAYQAELYARDPRNIVRVVLNRTPGEAAYQEAGETFRRWREEGVLADDPELAVYVLEQAFSSEGRTLRRYGVMTRFRAEDAEKRMVLPHEHTRAAAKEDRWKVLLATRANFSPIFVMFPDPECRFVSLVAEAIGQPAALQYTDDGGIGHRLWRVTDPAAIEGFRTLLGSRKGYIADGHHRYATALRYRDAHGPDGAWTLGYFTPMGAPGLLVLPYHRIVSEGPTLDEARSKLAPHFDLAAAADVAAAAHAVAASTRPYAFALAEPGGGALVAESKSALEGLLPIDTPASLRALDTYFLHRAVFGPLLGIDDAALSYVHSLAEAEESVAKGACRLAVLLRGTPVQQIVDVAEASESMPAKSTFFHPKLPSGLVIHPLAG